MLLQTFIFFSCSKNKNNITTEQYTIDTTEINVLLNLADSIKDDAQDTSLHLIKLAIAQSQKINYIGGLGSSYHILASIKKDNGQLDSALIYYKLSLSFRQVAGNQAQIASTYNMIGITFKDSAIYDSSIFYMNRSIAIAEKLEDLLSLSKFNNNLGNTHIKFRNYRTALQYYHKALDIRLQLKDTTEIAQSYHNMSSAYYNLQIYDTALLYAEKNLPLMNQLKPILNAKIYNNLGLIHQALHQNEKAFDAYQKSIELYRETDSRSGLATGLSNLGIFCMESMKIDSCYKYFKESTDLAEEENQGDILAINYDYLGDYFFTLKKYDEAAEYYSKSIHFDSINNAESDMQIRSYAQIQTKFETDKNAQEYAAKKQKDLLIKKIIIGAAAGSIIILLLLFNRRQLRRKIEYQKQLASDRTRISSDLHDDIGAALSSISMYSDVVKMQVKNNKIHEADELLTDIATTSRELMDNMSDLVWAINPRNDSFEKIIQRTKSFAHRMLESKNIQLHFDYDAACNQINLSMEARHNLFMIYKEAINNIAKYSGANNAYLSINKKDKTIISEVKDDGKGFEITKDSEGNGLKNMKRRAEEMHGEFEMVSSPGKGTRIQLKLNYQD